MSKIKEIAEKLGIHPATVSRALNDDVRISEKTRVLVKKVAEEIGYKPNLLAKYLRKGKSNLICLIVPDLTHPYYSEVFTEMEKILIERNYFLQLFTTDFQELFFEKAIEKAISFSVSGLVIAYHKLNEKFENIPVVLIDQEESNEFDCVIVDNFSGSYEAVEYLINLGHRKIGYISDNFTTKQRLAGYKKALEDSGIEINEELIDIRNGRSEEIGYHAALKLLVKKERPTAIFCGNDFIGIGVMKAATELNIKIPDELSIIGFDDLPICSYLPIPLTTVRQPIKEIARQSINLLFERMERPEKEREKKIIKPSLIIRETTKNIKGRE